MGTNILGAKLHDYDIDLTDYALGNFIQYRYEKWYARWIANHIYSPTVIEYLSKRSDQHPDAPQVRELLSISDMVDLEEAFEDWPPGEGWGWCSYESLHHRYIKTIREVRDGLSRQTAEDWSKDCVQFANMLKEGLSLHEGLGIVRAWVERLRKLQLAMDCVQFVPAADVSKWDVRTMDLSASGATQEKQINLLQIEDNIKRMREAIMKLGKDAKPIGLINEAKIKNQSGRVALRELKRLGEYDGFARSLSE